MTALLEASGLSKAFDAVRGLDDVSFSVEEGLIVGLIGPNGAGKSTLVNVVSGAYRQDRGTARFAGRDLGHASTSSRARAGLVRTFQRPTPIPTLSCVDGVAIGALCRGLSVRAARDEAEAVLDRLGLSQHAGDNPRALSTGQLKLLDLARVLTLHPRLVLLDELMSGLSASEAEVAQSAVESLCRDGITFLVIEHLLQVIRRLSRQLIVMDAGRIIAEGKPDEVIRQPRVIEAYVGTETAHASP